MRQALIVLQFGTREGEGGTFALFQGLFPPETRDDDDDRALTGDSAMLRALSTRSSAEKLASVKWILLPWVRYRQKCFYSILSMACCLTSLSRGYGTGSVWDQLDHRRWSLDTSGLRHVGRGRNRCCQSEHPERHYAYINRKAPFHHPRNSLKGLTAASAFKAFLIVLFGVQRFGTHHLAMAYAPIACIWLLLLGGMGIYNITAHPGIFRAFDPSRMVLCEREDDIRRTCLEVSLVTDPWLDCCFTFLGFVRTKDYDYLAGVLLAVTGCEAMFANLGQFNKASTQVST